MCWSCSQLTLQYWKVVNLDWVTVCRVIGRSLKWLNLVTNPRHFQYYKILKIIIHLKILCASKKSFLPDSVPFSIFSYFAFWSSHITFWNKNIICIYFFLFIYFHNEKLKKDIGPLVILKGSGSAWILWAKKRLWKFLLTYYLWNFGKAVLGIEVGMYGFSLTKLNFDAS